MYIEKLASAIRNDIVSGLRGYHQNLSLSIEQLQDEIVECRIALIKEYQSKNIIPYQDLLMAINCVEVDCKSLERCGCDQSQGDSSIKHFEIPQLISNTDIEYIGSNDRTNSFTIVKSFTEFDLLKYRKYKLNKPVVWIDYAPNKNGMLDCFVFNAPFLKQVSIVAIFKDPRQLKKYQCCNDEDNLMGADTNISFLDQLIKEKLTKEKIYYYRQLQTPLKPNDQTYNTGN